jgi:superfamily II DNA or RNA helicase
VTGAPGISISAVLSRVPESALRAYIGRATINVLSALNPELITRDNLVELAIGAAEPLEVLRREDLRGQLIEMLPLDKARELAERLGVREKGATVYQKLMARTADRSAEPVLMSFFGVVQPERAPSAEEAATKEVAPAYGLFPHQLSVAERTLLALSEYPFKTVVHMPTGSGKTRTAMHVVCNFANRNRNRLVVWLAQSAELLEQAADEFERAWASLGSFSTKVYRYWGAYEPNIQEARTGFLVAGFAKLHALARRDGNMLLRLGDRAVLTIVDEAHQAIAPTYRSVISNLHEKKAGNALLGLTATPGRTWADIAEDAVLAEFFGNRKITLKVEGYRNPVQYLIEHGYLAKPTFRTLNVEAGFSLSEDDLRDLSAQYDIPESVLMHLAEDDQRNIRIIGAVEELAQRHSRTIVFAATVNHAHLISSILSLRGTRSFVVTGLTDRITRERVITKFKSLDPQPLILCNYGVLTTGFDAPKTSAAVIARPTRSLVLYSQMVGRAIRGERAGGNQTAEIVTVVDPQLPGFGSIADAFINWEDVWDDPNG